MLHFIYSLCTYASIAMELASFIPTLFFPIALLSLSRDHKRKVLCGTIRPLQFCGCCMNWTFRWFLCITPPPPPSPGKGHSCSLLYKFRHRNGSLCHMTFIVLVLYTDDNVLFFLNFFFQLCIRAALLTFITDK